MSEAELHQIKLRLHQGQRQKAARGELSLPVPAGLAMIPPGPSPSIRTRRCKPAWPWCSPRSARGQCPCGDAPLRANGLPVPVRSSRGPAPQDVIGARPPAPGCSASFTSRLCRRVCLWTPASSPRPDASGIPSARPDRGSHRRVGGVPSGGSCRLHRLGGVYGQPAPSGRQHQSSCGGSSGCAPQGPSAPAG